MNHQPVQLPAWANWQDHCRWIDHEPVYSKQIGPYRICPSEYVNEKGALIMTKDTPCRNVVDPGESFCPRHKMIVEAEHAHTR